MRGTPAAAQSRTHQGQTGARKRHKQNQNKTDCYLIWGQRRNLQCSVPFGFHDTMSENSENESQELQSDSGEYERHPRPGCIQEKKCRCNDYPSSSKQQKSSDFHVSWFEYRFTLLWRCS